MSLCECGCGQPTKIATRNNAWAGQTKGQPLRFIVGHNPKRLRLHADKPCAECGATFRPKKWTQRFCSKPCAAQDKARRGIFPSGRDHYRYKGGWFYSQGRLRVTCRDGSHMLWSRIVAQDTLGRPLEPGEIVHHINGDHTDDRPENLAVMSQSEHVELHRQQLVAARWTEAQAVGA